MAPVSDDDSVERNLSQKPEPEPETDQKSGIFGSIPPNVSERRALHVGITRPRYFGNTVNKASVFEWFNIAPFWYCVETDLQIHLLRKVCWLLVRESKLSSTNILTVRSLFWRLTVSLICHWLVLIVTVWHHNIQNTLMDINTLCSETESKRAPERLYIINVFREINKIWSSHQTTDWSVMSSVMSLFPRPVFPQRTSRWPPISLVGAVCRENALSRRKENTIRLTWVYLLQVEIIFMMENIWLYLIHSFRGCINFSLSQRMKFNDL